MSNLVEMVNDFIEVVVDSTNLEILEMWRYLNYQLKKFNMLHMGLFSAYL